MRAISVTVGERIVYLGSEVRRADGAEHLSPGDIGTVVEVRPPRRGLGSFRDDDGEVIPDPDQDGSALVEWPHFRRTLIRVESEGTRWRKVSP